MPWLAVIDFLQEWDIGALILAAFVASLLVLAGSFGLATAWRRWKEARRRKARGERGAPAPSGAAPTAAAKTAGKPAGKGAVLRRLPKPSLPKVGKPSLPGLRRKGK